jgi:hypothetical protein
MNRVMNVEEEVFNVGLLIVFRHSPEETEQPGSRDEKSCGNKLLPNTQHNTVTYDGVFLC